MMKKLLFILFITSSTLLLSSCKKSSTTVDPVVDYYLTCKVDGADQSLTKAPAASLTTSSGFFDIGGALTNGVFLSIQITNPQVGTKYTVLPVTYPVSLRMNYANITTSLIYQITDGSFTITSLISNTVTGTFDFTYLDPATNYSATKKVIDGKFYSQLYRL